MLIIILVYVALIWLVFFKLKWLPFKWAFGGVAAVVGMAIIAIFVGLRSSLTPSGRIEVIGKVDEVTPNVSGQDTEVPVQRNVLLKAGRVLFRIDRAPHEYKVRQLRAALAEARPKVEQLKANVDVADADLKSLRTQWERADKRREDLETLGRRQATSQFNVEGAIAQANALAAQLDAAKARLVGAKGEGQFAASGAIQRVSQIGLTVDYAVRIGAPKCLGQSAMRLGMSGAATVFSDSAGAIGTLASILLWVEAHLMYLRNP